MPHGKICYVEIRAKDVEKSSAFYSRIFGWKLRARGDGATAFDDSSGGVSGVWVPEKDTGPGEDMVTYVQVDSIATALKQVAESGGKVVEGFKSLGPGMGFAIVHDPAGNRLGLYEQKA